MAKKRYSVIIPAHDEEAVISRCLSSLAPDVISEAEVIVVANGCRDRTAEVAKSFGVTVLEVPEASKSVALQAGDTAASTFPRIYLDADIVVGIDEIRAVAAALAGDSALVAAPSPSFSSEEASRTVQAYYRVFQELPYATDGLVGLGLYGLSEAGRARFGEFPRLTNDDLFVQRLFAPSERINVSGEFEVSTPRRMADLLRVRRRVIRGNREFQRRQSEHPELTDAESTSRSTLRALGRLVRERPMRIGDVFVYVAVTLLAACTRSLGGGGWLRDDSSRSVLPYRRSEGPPVGYVVSMYPALSHTFIDREIQHVERHGTRVERFSLRECPPGDLLTAHDRNEALRTTVLLRRPALPMAKAHLALLLGHPKVWISAFLDCWRAPAHGVRERVWRFFYFAEAVLLYRVARRRGVRHFHVHFANSGADVTRVAVDIGCGVDGEGSWTWSIAMHGPTEFKAPRIFDLAGKFRSARFVACISEYCREEVHKIAPALEPEDLPIVRMGVDVARYRVVERGQREVPGPLRILFVGRLVEDKAPQHLLEALDVLQDEYNVAAEATVVGSGPLLGDLQKYVSEKSLPVHFTGPVGQDALPGWYEWAQVFCLPSYAEGVPVVLMEAMATGLPVVSSRIAGIPELVRDQVSGLLVDPGDVNGLALRLRLLATSPEVRHSMGVAGRKLVEDNYSSGRDVPLLISAWARAVGGSLSGPFEAARDRA